MANAVRSHPKSLERHDRVYAYYVHLWRRRSGALSLSLSPDTTNIQRRTVKFSACTFSQILYTRQGTPRSSKYTGVRIRASYTPYTRQAFPRRDSIAIFATRATRARHSRYPNTYFFQTTPGNGALFPLRLNCRNY